MRYLNKIVFINSAHVRYEEVAIDGNVHFIGTQGVGKSTLLRAILFFYTAEKTKLGIGAGQRSFDDFYLPNPDSYIVYEIQRETGSFFVMLFKSKGRVAHRIVDCAYNKDFFVEENGTVRHEWGKISLKIGTKVYKSSIIQSNKEFRDIIYGNKNAVARELQRFNIMDSSKYQNIPSTIQNIFLNQSLESRKIQETIISSMDFTTDAIDLSFFRTQIGAFKRMYEDTMKWYRKDNNGRIKVEDEAKKVGQRQAEFMTTNKRITELASNLVYAKERDQLLIPELEQKETEVAKELEILNEQLGQESCKYKNERDEHVSAKSLLNNELKKTKARRDYWEHSNIKRICELFEKKESMTVEVASLRKELNTLMSNHKDIEQKYDVLLQNEQQKFVQLKNQIEQQLLELEKQFISLQNKKKQSIDTKKQTFVDIFQKEDNYLCEEQNKVNEEIHSLELEFLRISVTDPNSENRSAIEDKLKKLNEASHSLKLAIAENEKEEQKICRDIDGICRELQNKNDNEKNRLEKNVEKLEEALKTIDSLLCNQEGAFISWLADNVEGWENTLGKVLDEKTVLYNCNLSPKLTPESPTSLMGVTLDFEQIERDIRTPNQLKEEKAKICSDIEEQKKSIQTLAETLKAEQDSKTRKLATQLKEVRTKRINAETELRTLPKQITICNNELADAKETTEIWRRNKQEETNNAKAKALQKKKELETERNKAKTKLINDQKRLDEEYNNWLAKENYQKGINAQRLHTQEQEYKASLDAEIQRLKQQMLQEIEGKGIDSNHIANLQNAIGRIEGDLQFLNNNQKSYYDWERDTKELFELEKERQSKLEFHMKEIATIEERFREQEEKMNREIAQRKAIRREASDRQQRLRDHLKQIADWLSANGNELPNLNDVVKEKTLEEIPSLLGKLRDCVSERLKNMNNFKQSIDVFKSNFSAQNTFNFNTNLCTDDDYENFAAELHEFVALRKMDEYRDRTSKIYVDIIRHAARLMGEVMKDNTQVQKIINNINKDFTENNFAGVIKDIQLRTEPSSDRLSQLFMSICDFLNEAGDSFGELNLFSDEKQQTSNNRKALELVDALARQLDDEPMRKELGLQDTFKLEFKVKENDNETKWVEKLSSVGSEGTDILVKAMVNIMLINVFKSKESKKFGDFKLHCMMDEIGKLHPNNVKGILDFANKRNIFLINSSPTTYNASAYKYTYTLSKDANSNTEIKNLLTIK